MNYTQSITRRHRTAFVLAIDQSGSMVEELEFRGRRTSKAAAVAEVANSLLSELLLRATREGEVRDYYDIAVVGYSGEGVHSLLSADETFVPVSALRNAVRNTRRVSIERRLPDGQPAFNEVTVSEWIAPAASGQDPDVRSANTRSSVSRRGAAGRNTARVSRRWSSTSPTARLPTATRRSSRRSQGASVRSARTTAVRCWSTSTSHRATQRRAASS